MKTESCFFKSALYSFFFSLSRPNDSILVLLEEFQFFYHFQLDLTFFAWPLTMFQSSQILLDSRCRVALFYWGKPNITIMFSKQRDSWNLQKYLKEKSRSGLSVYSIKLHFSLFIFILFIKVCLPHKVYLNNN